MDKIKKFYCFVLTFAFVGNYICNESDVSNLFLNNVESLSAEEVHYLYNASGSPCPDPYSYKTAVSCNLGEGDDEVCSPSDCF